MRVPGDLKRLIVLRSWKGIITCRPLQFSDSPPPSQSMVWCQFFHLLPEPETKLKFWETWSPFPWY